MDDELLELFNRYQDELKKDVSVDELNLKDSALTIASIKHKWAGRLMRHKIDLNKIEKQREKAISILIDKIKEDPSIDLSVPLMRKKAENNETVKIIDQKIDNLKIIIEYLEKIEKIVGSMTWDIKNILEVVKIETQ